MAQSQGVYVALLRGINVGGKNRLRMEGLREVFTKSGSTNVKTYIQSGNVLFQSTERIARAIPTVVSNGIWSAFGVRTTVVVRTAAEFKAAAKANPFLDAGTDPSLLHVLFLAAPPSPSQIENLDTRRSPPDEFRVLGREVYLRLPNGTARSRFTNAYFDARLATTSTVRNWRTVLKLVEMTTPETPNP